MLSATNGPTAAAEAACQSGATICRWVTEWTGSHTGGEVAQLLLGTPLLIAVTILLGVVARWFLHRVIDRVVEGIISGGAGLDRLDAKLSGVTQLAVSPLVSARREQRARTMASVLKSVTTGVVGTVVVLMVLQVLGLPIAPVLASAGIVGVAVGFGAQTLVKDFLSGLFMLAEDQYGVGDVVDLGSGSGVVEGVGLRVTRLRDTDGTVWYVRNGEVARVGNRSQGWARAVLDVGISYAEDVDRASALLLDVATGLQRDPEFTHAVLEDPEVWGIESVSAEGVVIRLVVKTQPLQQWTVARELRRRIKTRFDAEGVHVSYHNGVWVTADPSATPAGHDLQPHPGVPAVTTAAASPAASNTTPSNTTASNTTPSNTTAAAGGPVGMRTPPAAPTLDE